MQFLFNEVYLPNKGLFSNSLSSVYGIGPQRVLFLLNKIGINKAISVKKLSKYKYLLICSLIRKYMLVDSSLRRLNLLD